MQRPVTPPDADDIILIGNDAFEEHIHSQCRSHSFEEYEEE